MAEIFSKFPKSLLSEIKILKALEHENIVNLIEVCTSTSTKLNRYVCVVMFDLMK